MFKNLSITRRVVLLTALLAAVGALAVLPAGAQTPAFCSTVPPLQFPLWNDAHGWSKPSQFETIQLADIDGDGQDELIARDSDGLNVYHWDASALTWILMLELKDFPLDFSDAAGWNQPERYQSISFIAITNDKKAQLLAIDASNDLLMLTYDPSLKAFRSVRGSSPTKLGPQARFLKLDQGNGAFVVTPRYKENTTTFNSLEFGSLNTIKLGSPNAASFIYSKIEVVTGDEVVNMSYKSAANRGWFYSVSAGDLQGRGFGNIIYPVSSGVVNIFTYQNGPNFANSFKYFLTTTRRWLFPLL